MFEFGENATLPRFGRWASSENYILLLSFAIKTKYFHEPRIKIAAKRTAARLKRTAPYNSYVNQRFLVSDKQTKVLLDRVSIVVHNMNLSFFAFRLRLPLTRASNEF